MMNVTRMACAELETISQADVLRAIEAYQAEAANLMKAQHVYRR